MDTQKTGLFITLLRKQKGLTQSQLATIIGVTDKAVSRWETGKGFPDVSSLEPLAAALGTSVSELVAGEPLTAEEKAEQSDSAILEALRYTRSMGRSTAVTLLAIAGLALLLSPLFTSRFAPGLPLAGAALLVLAVPVRKGRLRLPRLPALRSASRRAARWGTVAALAAAVALETLPWGAVLRFGRPPEEGGSFRETFSYFSPVPFGYANFFPLLTAICSAALLLLSLLQLRQHRQKLGNFLYVTNIVALVLSLLPLFVFGPDLFSAVGAAITVFLGISALCITLSNREGSEKR